MIRTMHEVAGETAWTYAVGDTSFTMVPAWGGKGVSLQYRGHEFLDVDATLGPPMNGGRHFGDTPVMGWDEMLPTIRRAEYPDGAYQGRLLEDHGDCWNQAWEAGDDPLTWHVTSHVLPIRMARTVTVRDGAVEWRYAFWNLSDHPIYFLHAPHPAFAIQPGSQIVIPDVGAVDVVQGRHPRQPVSFPCPGVPGLPSNLGRIRLGDEDAYTVKYYTDGLPSSVGLQHPDGSALTMRASSLYQTVAIWVNARGYQGRTQVAIEPCTGFYEDIPTALAEGRCAQLDSHATVDGFISVTLQAPAVQRYGRPPKYR